MKTFFNVFGASRVGIEKILLFWANYQIVKYDSQASPFLILRSGILED